MIKFQTFLENCKKYYKFNAILDLKFNYYSGESATTRSCRRETRRHKDDETERTSGGNDPMSFRMKPSKKKTEAKVLGRVCNR